CGNGSPPPRSSLTSWKSWTWNSDHPRLKLLFYCASARKLSWTRSIPLLRAGKRPVDDAAARMRQRGNLGHLLLVQHKIKDGGILLKPLDLAGARNDDNVLLHQKAQRNLRCALAMRGADAGQHPVVAGAAARDRAVGDDGHAVPPAGGNHFRLVEEGMALDLIADNWFGGSLQGFLDLRHGEVGYADMTRETLALDAGERAEGFRQRNLRARPMQQQEIDLAEAEPRQTSARGAFKLAGREVRRPDLRGHEDRVAPDVGCTQALAHRLLVVVHLGGVEVTVTEAQRLLDHAG